MLTVRDVLNTKKKDIWSIDSQSTAYKALQIMADKDIGALLVIDKGQLVGIFSEKDYARKVILEGKSSKETSVGELMTREMYSIAPDRPIEECMALMTATRNRHMPVFEDDQLVGIVALGDIVNAIISKQKIAIHDLENYIRGDEYMHINP
jgi:CBS domain-containing protein